MRIRIPFLLAVATAVAAHALLGNAALHLDPNPGTAQKPLLNPEAGVISGGLNDDVVVGDSDSPLDGQSPASCAACEATLLQLKLVALRGDDFFIALATEACKRLKISDEDVCTGSIALEGPIVAHSLRGLSIGSKTSKLTCVALFGWCSFPDVDNYIVSFPSPKPEKKRPEPSGQKPLQVIHYSDIHVDPWYTEGAEANCTKFICCRDYSDGPALGHALNPAGPNGEHTCDSPVSLEESMYAAIRKVAPGAAFSIFTGDIVDHGVWNTTVAQNMYEVTDAYNRMATAEMRVYGTAGNHEASPANSYPPLGVSSSTQWLYDVLSASWTRWVGAHAADTTREFGAYSTKYPGGNLRIISLSTNLYYVHNYWLYEEPMERDPSGQLAWLIDELDAAEKAGERVYIIGHMALGARDAFHDASNYFDQIVNRYEATIAALFFGHTHLDEFEISYSDYSQRSAEKAVAVSYIGPSMTPTSGYPAFRVYDIDPVTFGVLDITTYIANMSDPKFQSKGGPVWTKYYSTREVYGGLVSPPISRLELETKDEKAVLRELDPAFWHQVTEVFEKDNVTFGEYITRKRRGWQPETCDAECKKAEICKLRAGRAQDNCVLPGFIHLGHGRGLLDEGAPSAVPIPEHEECGGSVLAETLGTLAGNAEMRQWLKMWIDRDGSDVLT